MEGKKGRNGGNGGKKEATVRVVYTFICALIKRAEKQKNEENKEPCIID